MISWLIMTYFPAKFTTYFLVIRQTARTSGLTLFQVGCGAGVTLQKHFKVDV